MNDLVNGLPCQVGMLEYGPQLVGKDGVWASSGYASSKVPFLSSQNIPSTISEFIW